MVKLGFAAAVAVLITGMMTGCSLKSGSSPVTVKATIEYNQISAVSTVSGKIIRLNKQQGEPVNKGEVLAVIDNANPTYVVDQWQAVVQAKKARLEEVEAGSRPEQIRQAEAQAEAAKAKLDLLLSGSRPEQIEQAQSQVLMAEEALSNAGITLDYLRIQQNKAANLYDLGQLSKDELDNAKYKTDTAAKQQAAAKHQLEASKQQLALLKNGATAEEISAARANYEAADAQLALLKAGSTKQAVAAAQADFDQAAAQLNQAKSQLDNYRIVALEDGIIISKHFELGDVVNAGSNLADIAVANDLYAVCYVPDAYLDRVNYNQTVNVKVGNEVLAGRVQYIALKHEYTPKDQQSANDDHVATKVKIALKGAKLSLKPGMEASVEIPTIPN
ncbi:HlyD family efflux transporter periplasmic adaptor subunit [Paenibacillus sp. H1-7]|uniref:HlyD family secretion protein n=1 Tax=Paenibacillus sp. H1-7 TaxID=2282849 RepID=UPI001EF92774|nr:HlyD family efflux transporter periplasmic adaptor subunit [Paenibacillus sp. H1-7]ULL19190.1 HlyD family efflux transporter periplasmic adaptor subunit [Paenibacillus sp. H1-7]